MAQPELNHDAVTEILLRFPPDEPACLVRAALVCKPWRRILTCPAFLGRYREFHRTPPLLGFLHTGFHKYLKVSIPCFVPATAAAPPFPKPPPDCRNSYTIDCRHGRVLLQAAEGNLLVWDPITGEREAVKMPDHITYKSYSLAVLCATAGCDHRNCHDGPFLVLFLGLDDTRGPVHACVYTSKARAWGTPVSLHLLDIDTWFDCNRGALIRDEFYYRTVGDKILQYDLGKNCLSLIDPPYPQMLYDWSSFLPMLLEDGSLGLVGTRDSSLYLWSRKVKPDGVVGWVELKVDIELELEKLVPTRSKKKGKLRPTLIGAAPGVDVVFMTTYAGIFTFEFKSGKVSEKFSSFRADSVPFMSFYTPDYAINKKRRPWQQRHIIDRDALVPA